MINPENSFTGTFFFQKIINNKNASKIRTRKTRSRPTNVMELSCAVSVCADERWLRRRRRVYTTELLPWSDTLQVGCSTCSVTVLCRSVCGDRTMERCRRLHQLSSSVLCWWCPSPGCWPTLTATFTVLLATTLTWGKPHQPPTTQGDMSCFSMSTTWRHRHHPGSLCRSGSVSFVQLSPGHDETSLPLKTDITARFFNVHWFFTFLLAIFSAYLHSTYKQHSILF